MPQRSNSSIAFRMTTAILLFSLVLTVVAAAGLYYINYREASTRAEQELKQLEKTHLPGITESLWVMDKPQLQIQLNALLNIPHVNKVEIVADGQVVASAGATGPGRTSEKSFPLRYTLGH